MEVIRREEGSVKGHAIEDASPWYALPVWNQTNAIFENVAGAGEAAAASIGNICRRQAFSTDFASFVESFDEWGKHYPGVKPSSTTVEIGGPLPVGGALLILDLIGYCPE